MRGKKEQEHRSTDLGMKTLRSSPMRLFAAQLFIALLILGVTPNARADASLLVASTASTIGASAATQLIQTPSGSLGVFASRWDSKDHGILTGYGVRLGWNLIHHLGLEARASHLEAEENSLSTTLIPIEAALTWRFPLGKTLSPYLGMGIGYYLKDLEYDDTTTWEHSEKSAGYFALAGVTLRLGAVSLFTDAKYTLVGTDDELEWRGADIDAQNSLDGLSLQAGLKLGF